VISVAHDKSVFCLRHPVNCEVSTRLISSVFNVWRDGCQECVKKSVSFTNQLSLLVNGGTSGCVYDKHSVQLN
jgi:hypothetical protein